LPGPPPAQDDERSAKAKTPKKAPIDVVVSPAGLDGTPAPPPGLSAALLEDWATFWSGPLSLVVSTAELPALRRLYELRCRYDELIALAFAGGDDGPESAPPGLAYGSQGQLVEHPALKAALALERSIAPLEDRFGLTTKARQNMGIRIGQLADAAKRHPELLDDEEPPHRADPRLAHAIPAASQPRPSGHGVGRSEPAAR
jgi:hypothetical protein